MGLGEPGYQIYMYMYMYVYVYMYRICIYRILYISHLCVCVSGRAYLPYGQHCVGTNHTLCSQCTYSVVWYVVASLASGCHSPLSCCGPGKKLSTSNFKSPPSPRDVHACRVVWYVAAALAAVAVFLTATLHRSAPRSTPTATTKEGGGTSEQSGGREAGGHYEPPRARHAQEEQV